MPTVKVQIKWGIAKKEGVSTYHKKTALLIQNVPVAFVSCSGSWGWYITFLDKSIPNSIKKYYAKKETAMINAEKRFGVYSDRLGKVYSTIPK